jgi:hypothetical protein
MKTTPHPWPEEFIALCPNEAAQELLVEWECYVEKHARGQWAEFGILSIQDSKGNTIELPKEVWVSLCDTVEREVLAGEHDHDCADDY